jgi:membrane-associated phospholipid phosphatase
VVKTTGVLKETVDRQRPDGSNDRSFPSGHTSYSFALATLSNRNLDYIERMPGSIELTDESKTYLQCGNIVMASAVGWARIEGRKHYPSDVLAGAAIGSFLSTFIHDWLIGEAGQDEVTLLVVPTRGGGMVQLAFPF